MSSDDHVPHVRALRHWKVKGFAFLVGLLAFVVSAGCGGGSTNTNGGRGAFVSGTITVGTTPSAIAVDSTANKIYVTDFGSIPRGVPCSASGADVEAIDGATQAKTSVGFAPDPAFVRQVTPTAAALNPANHTLYVQVRAYWNGIKAQDLCGPVLGGVEAFDTTPLQPPAGIDLAGAGVGIDVNPTSGDTYVARGDVFVLDGSGNPLTTIPVGTNPVGVAVNATTGKIYVANSGSNNISVIDGASNAVVATVTDPHAIAPVALAVNATTNTIYVANSQSNNLTVIAGSTNAVTATIPVGASPSGVAVESQTNFIYVASAASGNITVINGMTNAMATLSDPSAKNPVAVAANSVTNKIYVANSGSNNVTVIDGAHE